jgi:integrase
MASIYKRGDYQWQAIIRRRGWPSQTATFETRQDAEKWARSVESEMDRGTFVCRREEERTSLNEALDRYAQDVTPQKRGAAQEARRLRRLKETLPFAPRPLASIRGVDVADFIKRRRKEGVKDNTIRLDIALLSHLFNIARREWGMEGLQNPCAFVRKPKGSRSRSRRLSPLEERLLLEAAEPVGRNPDGTFAKGSHVWYFKPLLQFAIETAMRRGELAALCWENIDLRRRCAAVEESKNGDRREVPLSPAAMAILRSMPRHLSGQVFGCTEDAISCTWQHTLQRARILYQAECEALAKSPDPTVLIDIRLHDLRHEAITRLAAKFSNVLELSAVSGHRSLQVLKRYYNPTVEELAAKLA